MWANAQRDNRPAEHWRCPQKCIYNVPAQKTAKHCAMYRWSLVNDVTGVMKPRPKTYWNLLGSPKPLKGSQPLVGWSVPYFGHTWRRYCCLTSFFSDCRFMP